MFCSLSQACSELDTFPCPISSFSHPAEDCSPMIAQFSPGYVADSNPPKTFTVHNLLNVRSTDFQSGHGVANAVVKLRSTRKSSLDKDIVERAPNVILSSHVLPCSKTPTRRRKERLPFGHSPTFLSWWFALGVLLEDRNTCILVWVPSSWHLKNTYHQQLLPPTVPWNPKLEEETIRMLKWLSAISFVHVCSNSFRSCRIVSFVHWKDELFVGEEWDDTRGMIQLACRQQRVSILRRNYSFWNPALVGFP